MSRAIALLLLVCLGAEFAYGMDCSLGESNFLQKLIDSCPGPLDSSEKSFCCYDKTREKTYCCTADEFAVKIGLEIIIPLVAVIAVILLVVCCVSCFFCNCCLWYRRRHHQGTVYGKVQAPSIVHVLQTSAIPQPPQNQQTVCTAQPTGMPQPSQQITDELYIRQAPYNPNYVQGCMKHH